MKENLGFPTLAKLPGNVTVQDYLVIPSLAFPLFQKD